MRTLFPFFLWIWRLSEGALQSSSVRVGCLKSLVSDGINVIMQRQQLSSESKLGRQHGGWGVGADTGRRHSILNCKPEANMSQLPGR